jgi:hypothetical protein
VTRATARNIALVKEGDLALDSTMVTLAAMSIWTSVACLRMQMLSVLGSRLSECHAQPSGELIVSIRARIKVAIEHVVVHELELHIGPVAGVGARRRRPPRQAAGRFHAVPHWAATSPSILLHARLAVARDIGTLFVARIIVFLAVVEEHAHRRGALCSRNACSKNIATSRCRSDTAKVSPKLGTRSAAYDSHQHVCVCVMV